MGKGLETRLERLEERAGGSQRRVLLFRVVGGGAEDGTELATDLIHPCFIGEWSEAACSVEIDRLRVEYPGAVVEREGRAATRGGWNCRRSQ